MPPPSPTKQKTKQVLNNCTHVLINHGGAIFLHVLDPSHTLIESCPPIESCAGSAIPRDHYRVFLACT